ncbi:hypothetical protein [uncultured Microbacterium sp.]|uniref:hypothetical protein n=1 Tax=uncultured Microbacterium sp. TaxID=191216 RepID=UPI0025FFE5F1|nr:hypothetical protein [uncultured Microbacterium sp.]
MNDMKRSRKISERLMKAGAAATLAGALFTAGALPAFAGTASSPFQAGPNIEHRSIVTTNSQSGTARSEAGPTSSTRAAGEVGGMGRAFNSSGALVNQSAWSYSNQPLNVGARWGGTTSFSGKGSYYSQGAVQYWTNGRYTTVTAPRTTNQTIG